MGKVFSVLNRKVNRFNVENRAHRIISKEKPTPAPRHPSKHYELKKILTDHPESVDVNLKQTSQFNDRLKQVYVVSHDPKEMLQPDSQSQPEITTHSKEEFNRSRPLPLDRQPFVQSEFGFQEPKNIPRGRCTLRQALKFIYDHQSNPSTWSIPSIAKEYKLAENNVDTILQYYRTFDVFIPQQNDKSQDKIATPNTGERLESGKSSSKRPG